MNISWKRISQALDFYQENGFQYLEVPWYISDQATNVTLPQTAVAMRIKSKGLDLPLVGSAEQSFVELYLQDKLKLGKYVAATPCFRDDPVDLYHQKTFFKVELIEVVSEFAKYATEDMAKLALRFFQSLPNGREASIVPTGAGLDINLHGVELGSYGQRAFQDLKWVYGTGLAEPRFSLVARP